MDYCSAIKRNEFESIVIRWMNLEPDTQSKVNQKEKNEYHIIHAYFWNLEKIALASLFTQKKWRSRWRMAWWTQWGKETMVGRLTKKHWHIYTTMCKMGFSGGSDGKETACDAGGLGSITRLGRSPGGGHGDPLQYSCPEKPHGQRSLAGYSPWNCKELDMTEQ